MKYKICTQITSNPIENWAGLTQRALLTWIEASMRSRGFWMHSSHRFSLEAVREVAAELASEVAG